MSELTVKLRALAAERCDGRFNVALIEAADHIEELERGDPIPGTHCGEGDDYRPCEAPALCREAKCCFRA